MDTDRRGQFGLAKPAFEVQRFKRVINIMANEEMATVLADLLSQNEKRVQDQGEKVSPHLYEFLSQLQDAIDQPPPSKGEKPTKPQRRIA